MILIPKPQKGSKENKITDQSLVGTQMLKSPIKNMQTKSKIQKFNALPINIPKPLFTKIFKNLNLI